MSAATSRTSAGRRESSARGEGMRNRAEVEAFRQGLHDFERRHGRQVLPTSSKRVQANARRLQPGQWRNRYQQALLAKGEYKAAASSLGIPYGTVLSALRTLPAFKGQCQESLRTFLLRQLRHVASGRVKRWTLRPKSAALLLSKLST